MPPLPPGYADVVRAHHRQTTGYLLAFQPRCAAIVRDEVRMVRRNLRLVLPPDLPQLAPRGSWLLGVLLGSGDTAREVAAWASARRGDAERIRFYHLPHTDLAASLAPWAAEGLPSPRVAEVHDVGSFHKLFGKHLNDQVWQDFR